MAHRPWHEQTGPTVYAEGSRAKPDSSRCECSECSCWEGGMNADPPTHFRPAAPENLWANRRRRLRPQEVLNANELEKGRAYEISLLSGAIRNRLRPAVSTRSEAGAVSDVDSIKPDTLVRCIDAPDLSLILKTVLRAIGRCHPNFQKA